jgi:ornithine cyclodeaminase/alanine dehydrogenase-like protein (mu-crystallin family)
MAEAIPFHPTTFSRETENKIMPVSPQTKSGTDNFTGASGVLFLTEEDVQHLLTMPQALEAVEEAFRALGSGKAENLPRRRLHGPQGMLHLMAASLPELGFMGYKVYTVYPQAVKFKVHLHSAVTGELLAILEADRLGQIRTGAASGVATRWMARQDSKNVGIFGSGWQARTQLEAVCQVRPVSQVLAFSRSPERLKAFCAEMQEQLRIPCIPASSPEQVAEGSDILITITNSASPVFSGETLKPGTHINAAGSNFLIKRELDEACIQRCDLIVVDSKEQAKLECGEFMGPLEKGALTWERIRELSEVVTGRIPSRKEAKDITLFKSQGLALEDVAVAGQVYRLAVAKGMGRRLAI